MLNVEGLLSWLSLAVALIAIAGYFNQRRKDAMAEGKRQQEICQLRKDLDHAYEKIHDLENTSRTTELDLAGLAADVKHIIAALERIETRLST